MRTRTASGFPGFLGAGQARRAPFYVARSPAGGVKIFSMFHRRKCSR